MFETIFLRKFSWKWSFSQKPNLGKFRHLRNFLFCENWKRHFRLTLTNSIQNNKNISFLFYFYLFVFHNFRLWRCCWRQALTLISKMSLWTCTQQPGRIGSYYTYLIVLCKKYNNLLNFNFKLLLNIRYRVWIGMPWMSIPIRLRQNDADPTRSGSFHNTGLNWIHSGLSCFVILSLLERKPCFGYTWEFC